MVATLSDGTVVVSSCESGNMSFYHLNCVNVMTGVEVPDARYVFQGRVDKGVICLLLSVLAAYLLILILSTYCRWWSWMVFGIAVSLWAPVV